MVQMSRGCGEHTGPQLSIRCEITQPSLPHCPRGFISLQILSLGLSGQVVRETEEVLEQSCGSEDQPGNQKRKQNLQTEPCKQHAKRDKLPNADPDAQISES